MQVTEHIHAIKIPFQVRSFSGIPVDRFVYAYLIYSVEQICLIDCGVAGSERVLFDYVRSTGRMPEDIAMIVQTHAHPDHIGATRALKEAKGCIVAAHPDDMAWIEDVELQCKERPIPNFQSLVGGSVAVDCILEECDVIDLGDGLRLDVLHTPGHSNGSISLVLHADHALFSGDAIPLAGELPIYDDVLASVASLKTLMGIDGVKVLLSSWDDPRDGAQVHQQMDEGLRYLQRIHEAVIRVVDDDRSLVSNDAELCRRVLVALGFPEQAANPLVARSFVANVKVAEQRDLLGE
ncbi:MAG: MBL fold metallo-hydrolase [Methanomicrobia archaeon]|nr:MBL fold metallo-hydrolase [Methanomicrobia archaeon]